MNTKTIYNQIYVRLISLAPNLVNMKIGKHQISKANGFMDLHLNIFGEDSWEEYQIISLAHYYKQYDDLVYPDPDIMIKIYGRAKRAEALALHNYMGYRAVYPTPTTVDVAAKKQLNSFLKFWLDNCIQQGHQFGRSEKY